MGRGVANEFPPTKMHSHQDSYKPMTCHTNTIHSTWSHSRSCRQCPVFRSHPLARTYSGPSSLTTQSPRLTGQWFSSGETSETAPNQSKLRHTPQWQDRHSSMHPLSGTHTHLQKPINYSKCRGEPLCLSTTTRSAHLAA